MPADALVRPLCRAGLPSSATLRVGLVDDCEITILGVREAIAGGDRAIEVMPMAVSGPSTGHVDIALYDPHLAAVGSRWDVMERLCANPRIDAVVLYTSVLGEVWVDAALSLGAAAAVSKRLGGDELAAALRRIAGGRAGARVLTTALSPPSLRHRRASRRPAPSPYRRARRMSSAWSCTDARTRKSANAST
ncbi:hypothetical protein BRM3_01250 [Brachybacterium huguangmaarense]|uniref:Response regulatory domain-containing protein n=1 Tax=Brachybacterium huguangmaarense TaxID=1652028 RepID=A0ABY6G1L3_9MICO|nr:hypothetical protein [Brachybacterium huguangmaarense]UYG17091.1 hypothetical protein BRM3_01250 [Brachybacterium huguangmaarense]